MNATTYTTQVLRNGSILEESFHGSESEAHMAGRDGKASYANATYVVIANEGIDPLAENPVIRETPVFGLGGDWIIREYAKGMFDAAEKNGPGLSPGFASYDEAAEWVATITWRVRKREAALVAEWLDPCDPGTIFVLPIGSVQTAYVAEYVKNDAGLWDQRRAAQSPRVTNMDAASIGFAVGAKAVWANICPPGSEDAYRA